MNKYIILSSTDHNAIENNVMNLMSQGWQCQGGVSVCIDENSYKLYSQAMIYHEPITKEQG